MELGLVGLGKMGGNMRERIRRAGHTVVGYAPDTDAADVHSLKDLVDALAAPRVVWLMVPAGAATQSVVDELSELLAPGDVIVDGGNSRWTDDAKHAEQLAPLIDRALTDAGIVRQDLTAIAAGVGPGPFTGLRVGLVTARTLAFVLEIPVYGVCSLDVLAIEAVDTGAVTGDFVVATDARRKEVYLASYAGGRRDDNPRVVRPGDVVTDRLVVGRGASLYPEAFPNAAGPEHPSAGVLCDVVLRERHRLLDPEPLYLRRPDVMEPRAPKRVS